MECGERPVFSAIIGLMSDLKTPPNNVEAERAVLGSILLDTAGRSDDRVMDEGKDESRADAVQEEIAGAGQAVRAVRRKEEDAQQIGDVPAQEHRGGVVHGIRREDVREEAERERQAQVHEREVGEGRDAVQQSEACEIAYLHTHIIPCCADSTEVPICYNTVQ